MVLSPETVFHGGMAQLVVGPEEVRVDVHIELLRAISPFFRKAFDGSFREAETKRISLPEDEPPVVTAMLSWAYPYVMGSTLYDEKKPVTDPTANSWLDLTKLWILGDKYQMAAFQNNIMHCLFAKLRASLNGNIPDITPDVFEYLYANTLPSACLREVLVAISVRNMCIGHFTEHRAEFPREFLEDFALNQMRVICLFDPSKITEFPKTLPKRYLKEEYSNDTATGSTTAIRGQKNSKGKKDRRTPISDLFKALGDRIDSLEADTEFAFQGSP